jgi:putative hydrolase of the HAD superfamily
MSGAAAAAFLDLWPGLPADRASAVGLRFRADPEGWFRAFTRGEIDFSTMRTRRIESAAQFLGRDLPEGARERFQAAYEPAFGTSLRAYDDAAPLLHAVVAAGLPLGVLTNSGGDYTAGKLAASGLADLLPVVVTRDTLGFGKPEPQVFRHACALLGTPPEGTVYVGDEYDVDVLGAIGAGLQPVWLSREEPDPVVLEDARSRGVPVVAGLDDVRVLLGL